MEVGWCRSHPHSVREEPRMNLHSRARTCPGSRALLVQRFREECWEPEEAAAACGVSRRTAYKWLARYRDQGLDGLNDRSSRPKRMPARTPDEWRALILELRSSRMTGRRIASQISRPYATVARILQRSGVGRLKPAAPAEPVRRYQRAQPGELLHVDVKKL